MIIEGFREELQKQKDDYIKEHPDISGPKAVKKVAMRVLTKIEAERMEELYQLATTNMDAFMDQGTTLKIEIQRRQGLIYPNSNRNLAAIVHYLK